MPLTLIDILDVMKIKKTKNATASWCLAKPVNVDLTGTTSPIILADLRSGASSKRERAPFSVTS